MRQIAYVVILAVYVSTVQAEVMFDWAYVGNAGNAPDTEVMLLDNTTGYGAVDYVYYMSKHEVTNAQYAEFLNAVAATDSFGGADPTLYDTDMGSNTNGGIVRSGSPGSYIYAVKPPAVGQGPGSTDYTYDNKPVNYVSYFDAVRFVNWLHNGQGSGGTETGAYNINDGFSETRSANAKYWIPSEDEWYKAAYYDPNGNAGSGAYYNYPTGTDAFPDNNLPSADTGNSANFFANAGFTTGNMFYPLTDVGAYTLSESPYGTFDQGGNVSELNEATFLYLNRGIRGGSWSSSYQGDLHANSRIFNYTASGNSLNGFRVASIPEPNTALLAAWALGIAACQCRGVR